MGDKGIGISDYQVAGEQKIRVSGGRGRGSGDRSFDKLRMTRSFFGFVCRILGVELGPQIPQISLIYADKTGNNFPQGQV